VASTITLPFDVIKTIKQIEMGEKDIMRVAAGQSRSNITIARELVADQGVRSLFSGLVPRLLKVAPACAIMISLTSSAKISSGSKTKTYSQHEERKCNLHEKIVIFRKDSFCVCSHHKCQHQDQGPGQKSLPS